MRFATTDIYPDREYVPWNGRWGYRFEYTDAHLTREQCEPLKKSYDVLGEQVLNRLNEISPPPREEPPPKSASTRVSETRDGAPKPPSKAPSRDLYAALKDHAETDDLLRRFWTEVNTAPEWVDWDQIRRGQDTFYRYGGAALSALTYHSLLGGMGAARVVETLARTGGFSTKVARHRLFETTQLILQCTRSLESVQPGGDGFVSTIRVRLLHAAVRQRVMKLASARPEYYDIDAWGVPINDLDSMFTIVSFSASLIWISLPRQGIFLRRQEKEDYMALWRYIGYVIGCPGDHFETPEKAKRLMETLLYHEVRPTGTSKILANNIIRALEGQPPWYPSADFLIASARWLNGHELSDALGLARPSLYYTALMAGQCLFFCFFGYTYRAVPRLDRKKIAMLKRVLYNMIVHSHFGLGGSETTFEFKHVPEFSTVTEMGSNERGDGTRVYSHLEVRNRTTLVVGTLGMCLSFWAMIKVVSLICTALTG